MGSFDIVTIKNSDFQTSLELLITTV